MSTAFRFPFSEPVPVAHNGAHGVGRARSSLASLARAVEVGAPVIEFDVNMLGDGTLVLVHDDELSIDGVRRPLLALGVGDLEGLEPGAEGSPLTAALPVLAAGRALVVLDWKGVDEEGRLDGVAGLLRRFGLVERVLVSTREVPALRAAKACRPALTTGYSLAVSSPSAARERWLEIALAAGADAVMLQRTFPALAGMVGAARGAGLGVFLWTATDGEQYAAMRALGPDGIMTEEVEACLNG